MYAIRSYYDMHQFPLDIFVGKGCIIDVRNQASIKMKPEYEETVEEGCILLLYTGFNILYGTKEYYQSHPCIDMDFCSFIVKKKIKMLGVVITSYSIHYTKLYESVLWPQARVRAARCNRPRLAVRHRAGGSQSRGAPGRNLCCP